MKAIIPIAGLGTRFLPLSKVISKELWPLLDKPIIHYILKEVRDSGIKDVIFVINSKTKSTIDYFEESIKLKDSLRKKGGKKKILEDLEKLENDFKDISFSYVVQRNPLGAAHAVFQARKQVKDENVAILHGDDVIESEIPCLSQLEEIFKTTNSPVIALSRVSDEKIPHYGIVEVEKIANRLYKIKKIVEKPSIEKSPSNLAITGRLIYTPEVFEYMEKLSFKEESDLSTTEVLGKMIDNGKTIYGYEFKGKWLECGNKLDYLKSNLYLYSKDPRFKEKFKNSL